MTDTSWQPTLSGQQGPKYLALSRALREAVRRGDLREGAQLPPVRDLAWRLGVTPGTVARAYQIGTQDGLLEAVIVEDRSVAARFRDARHLALGSIHRAQHMISQPVRTATVEADGDIEYHLDGEPGVVQGRVEVSVRPGALAVKAGADGVSRSGDRARDNERSGSSDR